VALQRSLPGALALLGPADHDDAVYDAGFTTRSTAELREAFAEHYRSLLADTPVSLDCVDWDAPTVEAWDATRRRANSGGISQSDVDMLSGRANRVFLVE
jgi:ring-1,2-phenylacetyl-CoA epoxidase subunit PaaC